MRLETKNRDHKLTIKILTEVIDKLALETLPHRLLFCIKRIGMRSCPCWSLEGL